MGFASGFRGNVGGSVQANYTDQPGKGLAGLLAFASEEAIANIDSVFIAETNGIACGKGAVFAQSAGVATDLQLPDVIASLPVTGNTVANFGGILLFDATAQSDSTGTPGYAKGRVGRFLRPKRTGGRVYVKVVDTVAVTDVVYLCTVASTDGAYQPGDFTSQNAAAGGEFTSLATIAKWIAPVVGTALAPALSVIEFGLV
jgi:hypothetical protein